MKLKILRDDIVRPCETENGITGRCREVVYEVEPTDVDKMHHHYRGTAIDVYTYTTEDVGRYILVRSAPGWMYWVFEADANDP